MYTIQTTGTTQGLLAGVSTLTFRLHNADNGQFPRCQTGTYKLFPRAMSYVNVVQSRFTQTALLVVYFYTSEVV